MQLNVSTIDNPIIGGSKSVDYMSGSISAQYGCQFVTLTDQYSTYPKYGGQYGT